MPTCSQAKILTNLEGDINKRLFKIEAPPTRSQSSYQHVNQNDTNYTDNYMAPGQVAEAAAEIARLRLMRQQDEMPPPPDMFRGSKSAGVHHHRQQAACDKFMRNFGEGQSRSRILSKRGSLDESYVPTGPVNAQTIHQYQPILHKIPIIFGDLNPKRDSVPINFLYNSSFRTFHRYSINQLKINSLRTQLRMAGQNGGVGSDGEEVEDNISSNTNSSGSNSYRNNNSVGFNPCSNINQINGYKMNIVGQAATNEKSYLSLPEMKRDQNAGPHPTLPAPLAYKRGMSTHSLLGLRRKSWEYNQSNPNGTPLIRSKRNSIDDLKLYTGGGGGGGGPSNPNVAPFPFSQDYPVNFNQARRDSLKKYAASAHLGNYFGQPRGPADIESMTVNNTVQYATPSTSNPGFKRAHNSELNEEAAAQIDAAKLEQLSRKVSLEQAKRLLAIASIRPSKTFHKLMTNEELEILKKYYELIKPKTNTNTNPGADYYDNPEANVYYPPLTYQSAKISLNSLKNLKSFIDTYKKDIDSGRYTVDYDSMSEPKGFVLKDQQDQSVIKFPEELNDSFFALAITHGDIANKTLCEANLYRIVNWNDTSAYCYNKKPFSTKQASSQQPIVVSADSGAIVQQADSAREEVSNNSDEIKSNSSSNEEKKTTKPVVVNFDLNADVSESTGSEENESRNSTSRVENGADDTLKLEDESNETATVVNQDDEKSEIKISFVAKKRGSRSAGHHLNKSHRPKSGSVHKHVSISRETEEQALPVEETNGDNLNAESGNLNSNNNNTSFENPSNLFKAKFLNNSSYYASTLHSPTSSSLSFDYIKSLSSLVNSIIEPKLLKQLSNSAVDVSLLPGGANYEIPSFEELGINIKSILKHESSIDTSNINTQTSMPSSHTVITTSSAVIDPTQSTAATLPSHMDYQSSKLKSTVYKKLKEKVAKAKVMWFATPPERKPMSVIFEYAGVDLSHADILEEVNNYVKDIGGHVEGLEFVPRSVHVNSVHVDNMWILTLNDMNTKFYTITNGIVLRKHKVPVRSYDEFIFGEYENFIRNEKFKQLIKNHEKAVEKQNKKKNS